MSTSPPSLYSLLPAIFRTRDAEQGGQLAALFAVLESQYGIVLENLNQLYDDQFIETCAPWVIPYLGELIGYNPVYTAALSSPDTRAEVANTIRYRRRKGTLLAMEQLTHDVSARTTIVVEEFRRLVITVSMRNVRLHNNATASLRRGRDWEDPSGPFTRLNRTVDVRRIAPRNRPAISPDPAPLDMTLHGGGRFNVPDAAVWIWRWKSWPIANAPAFALGKGSFFFNPLGAPIKLFQQPPPVPPAFTRLLAEADVPQPISRRAFAENVAQFYPSSIALIADGVPVDASRILSANLAEHTNTAPCHVPSGKIAIDPELGRIRFATDLPTPASLRVSYSYGAPAAIGGGPYDRIAGIVQPAEANLFKAVVGTVAYPSLRDAVHAWNQLPAGSSGSILLPGYTPYPAGLTGIHAVQVSPGCQLLIASAEIVGRNADALFTRSCAVLEGDLEIVGLPAPPLADGLAAPLGQVQLNGVRLAGELRLRGEALCLQIVDSTLVPGRSLSPQGDPAFAGEPSLSGDAIGATVCLTRSISGPIALPASCSVRVIAGILDASSPFCVAFAGSDLASAGASLHIEDSTVIGKVWTQTLRLASNTLFHARLAKRDPWKAAVWVNRRQVGCVRFCGLPFNSITPRRYECLPSDAAGEPALEPKFITLRFGEPGYCLLSGDVPLAIWKGASNGSQIGVYLQIQETEAIANVQIRSLEYLPANLERGIFLIPSGAPLEAVPVAVTYGLHKLPPGRCRPGEDAPDDTPAGIGIALI